MAISSSPAVLSQEIAVTGDITPAHDPVLIRGGRAYYSYATGQGDRLPLLARTSTDLVHWRPLPSPLAAISAWAIARVPGARDIWAPDIVKVGRSYRLYYAVSTFGKQRSVIGLATARSLDPASPRYGWHDEGLVIASHEGDDLNAIDPNVVRDRDGGQWLAFGSYWTGLKLIALDPATGKPRRGAMPLAIARRAPGKDAIKAPFIVSHGGWFWLIASFDHCCRGVKSDYRLVVGRARRVTGPYVDRDGRTMLDGGGTPLLSAGSAGVDRFRGPGHAGVLRDRDGRHYLIYHAYDAQAAGTPTLRLARLHWPADGWPTVAR